ncbi:MAG: putative drug exporter of the superfamily, partial [Mycobacterium sp.]|nr:putative drug exporter of the superfamily [Mycobacterium sp.]
MSNHLAERPTTTDRVATWIRRLCVPIVLFWVAVAALTNVLVPQLEAVGEEHNVALSSPDSPSLQAFQRIGKVFHEFDSDSAAMVVLEGDQPLGADAHRYYDELVKRFNADTKHVQHVQDFWGDPLTAAGSQSSDGKAAYVQVFLAGNQGEALSLESVAALRDIIAKTPAPPGVHAYVAGSAAQIADQFAVGNESTVTVTLLTVGVIAVMLLIVYRSPVTMILALVTVLIEMSAARGIVSFLANAGVIGLSTYSTNILTLLVIAAGTDYVIFLLGRYHEGRNDGDDREAAFYDMYRGTSHVILGSGLTIAGAVACLYFTRLPYFQSLGIPAAIGVLVSLVASLTLAPAVLVIGSRFGLLEPKRKTAKRGWRRIGTAIVRWPGPILIATLALALVGLASLSGYKVSYDISPYMPASAPSNVGYAAAERHFSKARLNPELLMIEADHDLRNPTDMILLERVAKAVFHTDGIAQVQSITRPLGTPLDHTSIPFQISTQSAAQINNLPYQQDRAADLLKQVGVINDSIDVLRQQYALQQQSSAVTHEQSQAFQETVATTQDLRDKIANFDDFFRPLRNYFYWEPHCFDIPVCWALRSLFDALDGINALTDQLANVSGSIAKLDQLQPKLLALIPPQIQNQQTNRDLTMTNYATTAGIYDQTAAALQNSTQLGAAYDASKTDDSFYLPPEAFSNPEFLRGLKLFLSPDGKAARMIITHDVDPATPEGISHIDAMRHAAQESVKGTPLAGSKIYIGGTASTYKDIADMAHYDLIIAGIAALSLIMLIMMFITRSLVAALVIVGTVALSLGASFGVSVLVWQHLMGVDLYWVILPLAVILLLAVGSDYNLLLVSRFKEEIPAGINTGIIRSMAGSGSVVTAAGLVFAFTMASFIVSDLLVLGQIGTTIALG